jgi:hypothetical protein
MRRLPVSSASATTIRHASLRTYGQQDSASVRVRVRVCAWAEGEGGVWGWERMTARQAGSDPDDPDT